MIEQWKNFSLHAREVLPLASEKRGETGSRGEREREGEEQRKRGAEERDECGERKNCFRAREKGETQCGSRRIERGCGRKKRQRRRRGGKREE